MDEDIKDLLFPERESNHMMISGTYCPELDLSCVRERKDTPHSMFLFLYVCTHVLVFPIVCCTLDAVMLIYNTLPRSEKFMNFYFLVRPQSSLAKKDIATLCYVQ